MLEQLERNAHAILGAAYAPVLQNLDSYQWTVRLIATGPCSIKFY